MKKTCVRCKIIKLFTDFPSRGSTCLVCKNIIQKKYYKENRKIILIKKKIERDDPNSATNKNLSLGKKGWTNKVLWKLQKDYHLSLFYHGYKNLWERKLILLHNLALRQDTKRIKFKKKRLDSGYENWKKTKGKMIYKLSKKELLFQYFVRRTMESHRLIVYYSNQNLWEKKFNSLESLAKWR